jgi:hypothetical protein
MPGQNDLRAHVSAALHHGVEVIDFEPQQYAVSVGLVVAVPDRAVMVFHFEAMQLEDELSVRD